MVCIAGGEKGSADTARDPRGFAVKFYTEEGNWDLVGNNTPIFFIRDPMLVSGVHNCVSDDDADDHDLDNDVMIYNADDDVNNDDDDEEDDDDSDIRWWFISLMDMGLVGK